MMRQKRTYRYINDLDKLTANYSSTPHRSLNYLAPRDVNKKNEADVWAFMYLKPNTKSRRRRKPRFWKVGLIEFHAKMTKSRITNQSSAIYFCSNICKCSIVDGVEKPLLRRLEPKDITSWNYIFETPLYLSLNKKELIEFEIYILTENESYASFIDSPLFLTLHFKQYPFQMDF